MCSRSILLFAVTSAALVAIPLHAQRAPSTRSAIAVTAGKTDYDLSGTGTRNLVAVRVQLPISQYLRVEAGVTYMNHRVLDNLPFLLHVSMPELQLQAAGPVGRFEPYLGIGAGTAIRSLDGNRLFDLT